MNYFEFSSDKPNIFLMILDCSSSMRDESKNVEKGFNLFKESFENFPDADSIAVSISQFEDYFREKEFKPVKEMEFHHYANGNTALFYSICKGTEYLLEYIDEVAKKKSVIPRATFIFFSDGAPCRDRRTEVDAKECIEKLNYVGVTTVFVAFSNDAIKSNFGDNLGFQATVDVSKGEALSNFLGIELSKSCKEQSMSLKALGSNFFSQAVNDQSTEYSKTTAQALNDDSWIDEI